MACRGRVDSVHCGCGFTVATPAGMGVVPWEQTCSLSTVPPRQAPLNASRSNDFGRPWLIVKNSCGRFFAENAGVMSGVSSLTEAQREALVATLEHLYGRFKTKVGEGRSLDAERVEELARGRIWSGRDALENGLIDGLGGLDVAFGLAKERAGIDGEAQVVLFPEEKDPIEQLIEDLLQASVPAGLDPAAVEAWVEEQDRPRFEARMPAIEVR